MITDSEINGGNEREENIYILKPIMTEYEKRFYNILKELEKDYIIVPQLNLASVEKKLIIISIIVNYLEILILQFFLKITLLFYFLLKLMIRLIKLLKEKIEI